MGVGAFEEAALYSDHSGFHEPSPRLPSMLLVLKVVFVSISSLAFVSKQPFVSSTIIGATSLEQLQK